MIPMSERHRPNIGVLASGNGSTFEAVYDAIFENNLPEASIAFVICNNGPNNPNAGVWQRAHRLGIDIYHVSNLTQEKCTVPTVDGVQTRGTISYEASERMLELANEHDVRMYAALGFMKKIIGPVLEHVPIGNSHPGPLPATAGEHSEGVQEAAIRQNLEYSGPTFHWMDKRVDDNGLPMYDSGPQIGHRPVEITDDMRGEWEECSTVEGLKREVMRVEKLWVPFWIQEALGQI